MINARRLPTIVRSVAQKGLGASAVVLGCAILSCGGRSYVDASAADAGSVSRCPRGATPAVVAQVFASAFLADGDSIYFAAEATLQSTLLRRVSKAGGSATTIAMDSGTVGWLAIDATHLYWLVWSVTDGSPTFAVRAAPKTGGDAFTVLTLTHEPHGLAVDDTFVYVAHPTMGELLAAPKAGGGPSVLLGKVPGARFFAQDAANLYTSGLGIWVMPKDGSGARRLSLDSAKSAVVDANNLYATTDSTTSFSVIALPLDGGSKIVLGTGQQNAFPITLDEKSVYWIDYGSMGSVAGTVRKVSKPGARTSDAGPTGDGGGGVVEIAANASLESGIAVDDECVYWQSGGRLDGLLLRAAK